MKYELNGLVFFNVVKGSTPPTDEVDCCIYPGQGELKIVTYSTDLSVCTISEVVCDTQNYKKTDPFLFPVFEFLNSCLLYTSPSPRDVEESRMPSSA